MKALLNIQEAGDLLGISPWTVRSYIADGKLAVVRIGRRILLEEEELQRLIDKCKSSVTKTKSEVEKENQNVRQQ